MKNNVMTSNKENDLKILEQALALEIEATRRYQEQHDNVKDRKSTHCWKVFIEMKSITKGLFGGR